jgi:hypothetical protein
VSKTLTLHKNPYPKKIKKIFEKMLETSLLHNQSSENYINNTIESAIS